MASLIYIISVLLLVIPMGYILATRQLQKYFVYFVVAVSFMVLNLLGTLSPHITASYQNIGFNLVFLLSAFSFHILFWMLLFYTKHHPVTQLSERLNSSFKENNKTLKNYVFVCLSLSFIGMLLFATTTSLPFYLRVNLFQHNRGKIEIGINEFGSNQIGVEQLFKVKSKLDVLGAPPGKLIDERIRLITTRPFHWFALCAFELPLFLLVLSSVCYFIGRNQNRLEQKNWRSILIFVAMFAGAASLWILSKQYLIYLMAAYFLVLTIFKNRIGIRNIFYALSIGIFALGFLYIVYDQSVPNQFIYLLLITLFHRIIEIYSWSAAIAYNMFPSNIAFLQGRSMINLFHMFNFQPVSVATLIYKKIYGLPLGSCPLPAIFESYVNWGWTGIVVTQLIIMATVWGVSLLSWSRDVWTFSLSCYLTIKLILFWQAPLWYGVYEPTLVFFVVLMCLFYNVWKKVIVKNRSIASLVSYQKS